LRSGAADDAPVEATVSHHRQSSEHVGSVGRREHTRLPRSFEAVHFREDLVERLLALVVCGRSPPLSLARAPDRIDS